MERTYDIFEKLSDGTMVWKVAVAGHEQAIRRLRDLSKQTSNELQLLHLPSKTLIASINT